MNLPNPMIATSFQAVLAETGTADDPVLTMNAEQTYKTALFVIPPSGDPGHNRDEPYVGQQDYNMACASAHQPNGREALMAADYPSVTVKDTGVNSDASAGHPVIFFDGVCGLCNRTVDFVIARDRARVFRFAPLQGETAQRLLQIAPDQPLNSMALVDGCGVHWRTDAVCRMLKELGGAWRVAGSLLRLVPRPIRNWGYDLVARNRYRWFGKKETCRLPMPEERALFLP